MVGSSTLKTCLLVGIFLEVSSGHFLGNDFPVNLTCITHVTFEDQRHPSFRCTWLSQENDSMGNCSLYSRASDELVGYFASCEYLVEWNLCEGVLEDGPVCRVPKDCSWVEDISLMLHCENPIMNFTSPKFSVHEIVVPNPPSGLHVISSGKGKMTLSWEWPSGWSKHDLHELQFNVKYWQEARGKLLSKNMILIDMEHTASELPLLDLSGFRFSYVNTCVQMLSIYKSRVHGHQSNWSAVVCNRTQMESPTGKPGNVTARMLSYDEKMRTRSVNLSWAPIPEIEQGGPIQYYEVRIGLSEKANVLNVSQCFIIFNELNTTHDYHIWVAAWNLVGMSTYSTYLLRRLDNSSISTTTRYSMQISVIVFGTVIIIVIISSLLVLKRKMREGNDIEWKLNVPTPEKAEVSQGNIFTTEKEVFDQLCAKKESNNNDTMAITNTTHRNSCQEEEYQPFIVEEKTPWCNHLQAESTGYVDAGGNGVADGITFPDLKADGVPNGKMVDLKTAQCTYIQPESTGYVDPEGRGMSDVNTIPDLKAQGVSNGMMGVDLKSSQCNYFQPESTGYVDAGERGMSDGNKIPDLKDQGVANGKMGVDLKSTDGNSSWKNLANFGEPYIQL